MYEQFILQTQMQLRWVAGNFKLKFRFSAISNHGKVLNQSAPAWSFLLS